MMDNLSISKKLWVAFASIIGVTMVAAAYNLYDSQYVIGSIREAGRMQADMEDIGRWRDSATRTHSRLLFYINSGDVAVAEEVEAGFRSITSAFANVTDTLDMESDLGRMVTALAAKIDQALSHRQGSGR